MSDYYALDNRGLFHRIAPERSTTGPPFTSRCGHIFQVPREALQSRPDVATRVCNHCVRMARFMSSRSSPRS